MIWVRLQAAISTPRQPISCVFPTGRRECGSLEPGYEDEHTSNEEAGTVHEDV